MLGITPCKANEMENPQFTSKALGRKSGPGCFAFPIPPAPSLCLVIHLSLVSNIYLTPLSRDELARERLGPLRAGRVLLLLVFELEMCRAGCAANTFPQQMGCRSSTMKGGETGLAPFNPFPSIQT